MANRRQQFLSRLLKISQLNQELVQVCNNHSHKQPVFIKKIQLLKMNHFNIKLPQSNRNNEVRHGAKILILNHPQYQMRQYNSTKKMPTNQLPKNSINSITLQTDAINARKLSCSNNKIVVEKKRASFREQQKRKAINYINVISSDMKNNSEIQQEELSKRIFHKKQSLIIRNGIKQSYRSHSIVNNNNQDLKVSTPLNPEKSENNQKESNHVIKKGQNQMVYHNNFSKKQLNEHLNRYLNPQEMIYKSAQKRQKYFKSMNHMSYLSQQKNLQEEKKNKLMLIKQINKNYGKPFHPPPKITAKSYIICQIKQNEDNLKVIVSFNSKNSQEVASLTKIMTCIIIIEFCEKNFIDMASEIIKIGKYESSIGGTSAQLKLGQMYTVIQLLHGLMLPSGNDASLALAVWCGRKLIYKDRQERPSIDNRCQSPVNSKLNAYSISNSSTMNGAKLLKSECYIRFIKEMNYHAKLLQMKKTHYSNSHGLINPSNRSTAYDIALLSKYAMNNKHFRDIVSCKSYRCKIKYIQNEELKQLGEKQYTQINNGNENENESNFHAELGDGDRQIEVERPKRPATAIALSRPMSAYSVKEKQPKFIAVEKQMTVDWKNTHKLLQNKSQQYIGIKTGFTNNAGPCLSSYLLLQERQFLIIVLSCAKMSLRFKQTQILKKWLCKQQNLKNSLKKSRNSKIQFDQKSIQLDQNIQNDQYLQQDDKLQ